MSKFQNISFLLLLTTIAGMQAMQPAAVEAVSRSVTNLRDVHLEEDFLRIVRDEMKRELLDSDVLKGVLGLRQWAESAAKKIVAEKGGREVIYSEITRIIGKIEADPSFYHWKRGGLSESWNVLSSGLSLLLFLEHSNPEEAASETFSSTKKCLEAYGDKLVEAAKRNMGRFGNECIFGLE